VQRIKQGLFFMSVTKTELAGYAVFAGLFLAVALVRPAHADDAPVQVAANADATSISNQVETVVVSARRRSEDEQNVPISLTAITGDTLAANRITNALNLDTLVPSLQVLSFNARNTNVSIRGLGSNIGLANDGIEGGVGIYVDGVLYPRPAESTFDLPDIATIEVLRGPQGTLYGKNTTSGAINITTQLPSATPTAKASFSYGDFAYKNFNGTVSGPITDDGTLLGSLTAFDTDRDGFIHNITTDRKSHDFHDYGFRAQALWQPTSDFTLRIIADYNKQHENCCITILSGVVTTLANGQPLPRNFYQRSAAAVYTPVPIDPFARVTDANSEYHEIMEQGGISAQADWQFGGGYSLTSITAWRFWNWNPDNDGDITRLSVLTRARQADQETSFSQELRIASPTDSTFEYSAGLYYFWEDDKGFGLQSYGQDAPIWILGANNPTNQLALNGVSIVSRSDPRINSFAAYGQATWHITPDLDLIGGVRYTYEEKSGTFSQIVRGGPDLSTLPPAQAAVIQATRAAVGLVPIAPYRATENKGEPSGLVTAVYKFDDTLSGYATFSHGAKSGGLNLTNVPPAIPKTVEPEYEDNYEIGFKSVWFDHRLVLNADAFWDNDTNYQATIVDSSTGIVNYIANIPSVRSRGFEADLRAEPIDGLSTYLSGAYTDAIYDKYPGAPCPIENYTVSPAGKLVQTICNLSGKPLPAVSKWGLSAGSEYDHALSDIGIPGFEGYVGGDVSYHTSYFSSADDSIYGRVPSAAVTNFRLGVRTEDGHWDASVWALNAFDTHYYQTIGKVAFNSGALSGLLGDPRTVGVTLRVSY
jgi:iron complex outermembrane receptor protein